MLAFWPLVIVLAVGVVLVGLLIAGPRLFTGIRHVTRAVRCPLRGRNLAVEFETTAWEGKPVDVSRCSAFTPPAAVDCEKLCLGHSEARTKGA
jgi:hypothetical protein